MPLNKVFLYAKGVRRLDGYRRQKEVADLVHSIGIAFSGKGFDEYIKTLEDNKDG